MEAMSLDALEGDLCEWCGKPYEPKRCDQKYCCKRCRIDAYIARQVEKYRAAARADNTGCVCPICGKVFDATNRSQKYCCRACAVAAANNRQRGGKSSAEAIAELRCRECGGPMPDAKNTNARYCLPCRDKVRKRQNLERNRRFKARKRAERRAKVMAGADLSAK